MGIVTTKEAPQEYPSGIHPLELYLKGSIEQRSDIILNHSDLCGYVYIHDRIVTKTATITTYDHSVYDQRYRITGDARTEYCIYVTSPFS